MAQVGEYFESYTVGRSSNAIKQMMSLAPGKATVLHECVAVEVNAKMPK